MSSAFDRRRIQAPESSYTPVYQDADESEAGPSRRGDRTADASRPIFLKTGLISQANGSGYIESGKVKIACSVYGPRPKQPPYSPQGSLNLEVKFAPFASHPRRAPLRDTEPTALSALITSHLLPALQLHLLPKAAVDVFLLVLESDDLPSVLSASLTVASAAIAEAGIPMSALGVGSTIAMGDAQIYVDPEQGEESRAIAAVGVLPAVNKLSGIWLVGDVEIDEACEMIGHACADAKVLHSALAQALVEGAEQF